MVNTSDFAKRLQKVLDYYGVSATAFSEEIEFNRSTISHLLSGRNKPSLEFVLKVLQKYPEVELYWLLNGKGSFPKSTIPQIEKPKPAQETISFDSNSSSDSTPKTTPPPIFSDPKISHSEKGIERIVIFYNDGTFKVYEN
ncbi:helix-turn-helix domain-containing protein [Ulvibacter litoralis]|uniref:HTH cro/C1-type domain-containing protein n=1 Tax=Ulvibacter litoralis TaxID=227084 RepID=A0A1G7FB11_9FLAO|nr:helix-turn-helix transcriptional regulator [Ulvibacter litoralis]GHC51914.1 transcriptional regulator [Ulvibacter litoralis]SDE73128.1 hypothetical protein SAMN05421855_102449 [Ulvibacter litoralis]